MLRTQPPAPHRLSSPPSRCGAPAPRRFGALPGDGRTPGKPGPPSVQRRSRREVGTGGETRRAAALRAGARSCRGVGRLRPRTRSEVAREQVLACRRHSRSPVVCSACRSSCPAWGSIPAGSSRDAAWHCRAVLRALAEKLNTGRARPERAQPLPNSVKLKT